ncbi:uncharacterized protein, YigZ family [Granulicatella balaenopterae]|uniref:Uncharacterized protein, YigZ family n=1 Tax=Granulicatella balaenopterae TaxID=137733 RepID=A0A1H9NKJ8_9LACT|nr:YigZ family protein [Granulicatella balaenopterae]SER36480.1 uncharacterized protein, YigZ family [Granulicatella balaenopterae]
MKEQYKTIIADGVGEIDVKGSRFIAHMKRAESEVEAQEFIQSVKKEHWKATHNCSAYLIGENDELQRANDDGEPSGTAGVPMLEVLKKNELQNVCCVVTRYFGGTKLGAGGLIRAYTGAVVEGLNQVGVALCSLEQVVRVELQYALVGKLEHFLTTNEIAIVNKEYTDKVAIDCSIPMAEVASFKESVIELLSDQAQFSELDTAYIERPLT